MFGGKRLLCKTFSNVAPTDSSRVALQQTSSNKAVVVLQDKRMDVAKALTPHLECPVCLNVPRDGVVLMCVNGHSVCNVCLNKLGKEAKCPLGRYCTDVCCTIRSF
jgi:hypothetical protein